MSARRRLMGTIAAAAVVLAFGARITAACDEQKADAKDAKAAVAADGKESKGGCAAHCAKKATAEAKNAAPTATVSKVTAASAGKNAKKTVKPEAVPAEAPKPETPPGAGSNR